MKTVLACCLTFALPAVVAASSPERVTHSADEAEALDLFFDLARRVAEIPSVHFRYSIVYRSAREGGTRHYRCAWDYDAVSVRMYHEVDTIAPSTGEILWTDTRTWDGRNGFIKAMHGDGTTVHVVRYPLVPPGMGDAHMGSNHVYYPRYCSLISFLETRRIVADRLPGTGRRYRVAVDEGDPWGKPFGMWAVYVVTIEDSDSATVSDRAKRPGRRMRLEETRRYLADVPRDATGNPRVPSSVALPSGLELPEAFGASFLHWRKTYRRFQPLDGVDFPVLWDLVVDSTGDRATVELVPGSLRSGIAPAHGYTVPLAPGERYFDAAERLAYKAGDPEHDFEDDGLVCERDLNQILEEAGATFVKGAGRYESTYVPQGCAADSIYLILAACGRPMSLTGILDALEIRPGRPASDLGKVTRLLSARGLEPISVKGSPEALGRVLRRVGNAPVLLHEPGDPVGHFFCARDYREGDRSIQVLDPPREVRREPLEAVLSRSSGIALVVAPELATQVAEAASGSARRTAVGGMVAAVGVAGLVTSAALVWRMRRRHRHAR